MSTDVLQFVQGVMQRDFTPLGGERGCYNWEEGENGDTPEFIT
jgi:hypothetical protein